MNLGPKAAAELCRDLKSHLPKRVGSTKIVLFPQAASLSAVAIALKGTSIEFGAQNFHSERSGAFTGENSLEVMVELGVTYALVGHSERRQLFGETKAETAKKVKLAQGLGVTPVLCVGETLTEREGDQTEQIIKSQLTEGLSQADLKKTLLIAYEPVWAIGTGQVANPQQVGVVHQQIKLLLSRLGANVNEVAVLYGGSVKPENAKALAEVSAVDGFLVGGAALNAGDFVKIASELDT